MSDPRESIRRATEEAVGAAARAGTLEALEEVRVRALGRRAPMTELRSSLGSLGPEERRDLGRLLNEARIAVEEALTSRRAALEAEVEAARLRDETIDVTLPGRAPLPGHPHPISSVIERITDVFVAMGYQVAEGPEVETDRYNFEALNIPADHPARSMHDTMFLADGVHLLRTHTSPVQIRVMETQPPPVYVIVPGRVYRRDPFDASHSPCFHQVEGLAVDAGITFADLRGTLAGFARALFGPEQKVRMRPSYFPFTEPSAEVDVVCIACGGSGCGACKRTGWMEILGAGMVHPSVLKGVGYDPSAVSGFAFGMGVERIAMLAYGIHDMRLLYENDQRFLAGFHHS